MATLLVNPKMNPALAGRVQASVTGKRGKATALHAGARWVSRARFVVIVGIVGLVVSMIWSLRRERAQIDRARSALLAKWNAQTAMLTAKDKTILERVQKSMSRLAGVYTSDIVVDQLRLPGALTTLLARPALYIRGPVLAVGDSSAMARVAVESGKDTWLLCLLDPPTTNDEKALLSRARFAMIGGAAVQRVTPNVIRLYDAIVGFPVLLPPFGERIKSAQDEQKLMHIERELKRAPMALAKRAMKSEILIAVLDEPNDKGGVTELDGEAAHNMRISVIDLETEKPLLQLRQYVDPNWITPNRRPQYARELDGCRSAIDVRAAIVGASK